MNATEKIEHMEGQPELDLSLITLEKAKPVSIWQRLKKSFSRSDLTIRDWEKLESKRSRHFFDENQWRNF